MKMIIFPLIVLASCLSLPSFVEAKGRDEKCNCGSKCGCGGGNKSEDCNCHNKCDCRDGKALSMSSLPESPLEAVEAGDEIVDEADSAS